MTFEPRRCQRCNRLMGFEMSYLAGSPIVIWHCDWCGISSSGESTIATNHIIYFDKDGKGYYADTANMQEHIWGGKRT